MQLRRDITGYLHQMPRPAINLYRALRMKCGLTQEQMCERLGIGLHALRYRERIKRIYHLHELAELQRICKLSDRAMMDLIRNSC